MSTKLRTQKDRIKNRVAPMVRKNVKKVKLFVDINIFKLARITTPVNTS